MLKSLLQSVRRVWRQWTAIDWPRSKIVHDFVVQYEVCLKTSTFNSVNIAVNFKIITGSTVVLTCCKGDGQSQWKTPIFGPSQLGNPLTDFDKI